MKAQDFQGVAYYSSQSQIKGLSITSVDMTPEMKERAMEKMRKAFEKNYVLIFNKSESTYQQEEKLGSPSLSSGDVQFNSTSNNTSKYYKNLYDKIYISEEDIFGKEFLVTDMLSDFNWMITNEQKQIGGYICKKAQIIIPVSQKDLDEYQEEKKEQEKNKTNFYVVSEPKERMIEAWFSPDIPVSNGPDQYWGLPGLILELHYDGTSILCTKIVLNPKIKFELKAPTKGKKVNRKNFEEISERKLESMKNKDGVIELKVN
jgi:GLPGLI family protein